MPLYLSTMQYNIIRQHMKKYKICIWSPIPSPHQKYFFEALARHPEIDLVVSYYVNFPKERLDMGWSIENSSLYTEQYDTEDPQKALTAIDDWQTRIHVIPGISSGYMKQIHSLLLASQCQWIHWTERSGIVLADKLNFNMKWFHIFYFLYRFKYYTYAKQINKTALGVFAIGKPAKNDFISWGVKPNKIEYLPYTIKDTKNVSVVDGYPEKKIFLYVGSLIKRKGLDTLLKAFVLLENRQEWILMLIGSGDDKDTFIDISKKLDIAASTFFIDSIPMEQIKSYMQRAQVFILPSLFDGWGAVLNEAASVKKPLISTDECGAAYHLIEDQENGFRIKAGSVEHLRKALQFYIDNPEKILVHGEKSWEIYQNFTSDKNVGRFMSALTKWQGQQISL